jgi:hypothetical protein
MKKSKLKKIAKLIHQEVRGYEKSPKPIRERVDYNEHDPEVSEKVKNLILNIIKFKDNIHISSGDDYFSVSSNDATQIKKPRLKGHLTSDERYLEIGVQRGEGFTINYGYSRRSNYCDVNLFDELNPVIKKRLKEINAENFSEIWETLMKESGIMRDSNLEQLFNE